MRVFWRLDTERQRGQNTIGPIPWSKVREYVRGHLELPEVFVPLFWTVISKLDAVFLGWQRREYDRTVESQRAQARRTLTAR
jgi:hypothetical protein